jgi:acetylornithine deacetylase/succinyl-diaminopimelate desuccinylase-like protein
MIKKEPHSSPDFSDNHTAIATLSREAIALLKQLIRIPSLSKEEDKTADAIQNFVEAKGVKTYRKLNNIWCFNQYFDENKPTILLNSHHDTVKANSGYTLNPFEPLLKDGKLYGLGSNFTVDIRVTDKYSNAEVLEIVKQHLTSEVRPRSLRLNSSSIPKNYPIVQAGIDLGRTIYGSPTSSDQALMNFPTLKIGVGDSARSHTADEYVELAEIEERVELYVKLLGKVIL